jgi:hypothetical protein
MYAIGTKFTTGGKHPKECVITDIHTTTNLAAEVVKVRYVATHQFCGQTVTDADVCAVTIARGLIC